MTAKLSWTAPTSSAKGLPFTHQCAAVSGWATTAGVRLAAATTTSAASADVAFASNGRISDEQANSIMTQSEIGARSQFGDIICLDCKAPASKHGLHDEIHVRGKCPWTWVGVIRREYARAIAERCTNPLRSEITCDMLVRDNDNLRAALAQQAHVCPELVRELERAAAELHHEFDPSHQEPDRYGVLLERAAAALVQQAQEGYRTEQLPDVDFVVNASVSDVVELITTLRNQIAQQAQPCKCVISPERGEYHVLGCPNETQQAQPLTDEITFVGDALAADANRADRPEWCYENARVAVAALNEYRNRMPQQAQANYDTRDCIVCHERIAPNYGVCFKCHTSTEVCTCSASLPGPGSHHQRRCALFNAKALTDYPCICPKVPGRLHHYDECPLATSKSKSQ